MIGPSCTAILFVLTLFFDRAALYGRNEFSILALSTKIRYPSYLKKVFIFKKVCFKVTISKRFKISSDCCIKKLCRSLKRRAILKGGKVKHELRVTSSNPRVTSSIPRVTSSDSRVRTL